MVRGVEIDPVPAIRKADVEADDTGLAVDRRLLFPGLGIVRAAPVDFRTEVGIVGLARRMAVAGDQPEVRREWLDDRTGGQVVLPVIELLPGDAAGRIDLDAVLVESRHPVPA